MTKGDDDGWMEWQIYREIKMKQKNSVELDGYRIEWLNEWQWVSEMNERNKRNKKNKQIKTNDEEWKQKNNLKQNCKSKWMQCINGFVFETQKNLG